jgi:hypothetical protein
MSSFFRILQCEFNNKWLNKTADFTVTPTNIGFCFTFNSGTVNYQQIIRLRASLVML